MRSKIFIVLILVIFLGLAVTIKPKQIGGGFVYSKELGIKDSKIFNLSASMLGEGIDSYDGDFSLSPDGDKIAFTGLKQEPGFDTGSSPYLFILNLKTGTLKKFEKGTTLFDWESSDILSYLKVVLIYMILQMMLILHQLLIIVMVNYLQIKNYMHLMDC